MFRNWENSEAGGIVFFFKLLPEFLFTAPRDFFVTSPQYHLIFNDYLLLLLLLLLSPFSRVRLCATP